jgi:hypothetical protein
MEKRTGMSNVRIAAFFMAFCIFFESTAFGFKAIYTGTNHRSYSKDIHEKATLQAGNIHLNDAPLSAAMKPDGGPDQPEVQSFSPIGVSDMVDPFSGDFSYNIPLMDVDGYPINIAYSAGVTVDQEASWVGLGWNLNPGVVNRSMRGVPDEYNGTETITKEMNLKKNWTVGGSLSGDYELFGFGPKFPDPTISTGQNQEGSFSLSASLGINYNNYSGFSSSFSIGVNSSGMGLTDNSTFSAGLGFSGSSTGGASISPSLGLQIQGKSNEKESVTNGINLGSSLNSRGGLQNASVGYTRTTKKTLDADKALKGRGGRDVTSVNKSLPIRSSYNFGMSTYTPMISMPMATAGGTFSFKLGGDIAGNDLSGEISGFYNEQWLKDKTKSERAFGYMNLQGGQNNSAAMLDFNRENDGVFTKNVPALPIPNLTYDIFSVSGQGVGGSYRPVRRDIGYVFDPDANTNSINGSLGVEVNLGGTFKGGIDVSLTYANSQSGAWKDRGNEAASKMKFNNSSVFFREANEMAVDADPAHFNKIGGAFPVRFDVKSYRKIENKLKDINNNSYSENNYSKTGTDRRNQVVYTLSVAEVKAGLGIHDIHPNSYVANINQYDHHIGQFTVLNVEGARYVYGIPAYSIEQKNVSFAVGTTSSGSNSPDVDCVKGLVDYTPGVDNSTSNARGIDNYYNSVTTPPFAHSYLLTTVLNADYVDADNIKGPSKGDLGGYLTFSYKKVSNYKWRNPVDLDQASYDEGYHTDNSDDKGHYISGTKELWYVKEIKSKNHIAVFHTSPREDAVSVYGENGGLNGSGARMERLDSIQLFSLPEFDSDPINAKPLKTVHFRYEYSLCPYYSGNINNGAGKLTLTEVFFTYQGSHKGRHTRYKFEYGQRFVNGEVVEIVNPSYNIKEIDRWNNYKAQGACSGNVSANPLKPSDFPYVGFDQEASNKSAIAWNLTTIKLPSGGKIEVDYESDDYAYVQHRRANQMFKIIGVESPGNTITVDGTASISNEDVPNAKIYIELMPDSNSPTGYHEKILDYVRPGQKIYFRALMKFSATKYDFVPGYAVVGENQDMEIVDLTIDNNQVRALKIGLVSERLKDNESSLYNPIAVAAIQFARIHLSKFIPPSSNNSVDENAQLPGLLESLGGAFSSFQELFVGPNKPLWNNEIGTELKIGNSWVRLQNPNKKKLGGGHRVKEIRMYDSWSEMTGSMDSYHYGQVYSYTHNDGTSSGVAAYEPQIGGDENPFRQPISADVKHLLAPDEKNYRELPFGEQFFPSPRVGYAMVTIADLPRPGVKRTATGKVVHEFYTAKEFPTFASNTSIEMKRFKLPIFAPFFSSMVDEMAASQGFVVENNDMHGKPLRQSVYAADQSEPITKVEYFYQSETITLNGISVEHLTNNVTTIAKNGTIGQSTIGLTYDAVADFRKSTNNTISGSLSFNTNFTLPFVLIPTIMASISYERTAFRSATFTKVIERFGIQSKTVATDLGSKVETNNLAYDAETGTVLLTETTTNFNDKVYNFTYPAHWYYDQMGQAYRNIGNVANNLQFVNGGTAQVNSTRFSRGDEVAVKPNGSAPVFTAWVTEANSSGIRILLKDGSPLEGSVQYIKVLRSGRRNLQTTPVGTVALRNNPLSGIQGNVFEQVLQAGAVEYSDDWRTFCECFLNEESAHYTTNPFVLGTRGTWRPVASYVHLSGRTQTFENGNSNIRVDGMFTSFTPFYKLSGGQWNIDRQNWTYTSSVVEFSPFGQALETVDALSRYSSSMFGYNQTLPIAVAANTRYRQLGYDGFEDYDYDNCSDNHFRIGEGAEIVTNEAHTGRKSIRVTPGNNVVFSNTFNEDCDEAPCDLQFSIDVTGVDKGTFIRTSTLVVKGGQLPYSFDYQILEGNASVELGDDGDSLIITDSIEGTPNQTTVRILITDANGCQKIIEI